MQEIISIFADIFASKCVSDRIDIGNMTFVGSDIAFINEGYAILENRIISDSFSKAYYPQDYIIKEASFFEKPISLFFYDLENGNYIVMECKGIDAKLHLLTGIDNGTWNGICEILMIDNKPCDVFAILRDRDILIDIDTPNIDMCRSRLLCSLEYLMQAVNGLNSDNGNPISPIAQQLKDLEKNISIVCSYEGYANLSDMYDKKYPNPTQMIGFYI